MPLKEVSDPVQPGRDERVSRKRNASGVVKLLGVGLYAPPDGKKVPSPPCPLGVVIAQPIIIPTKLVNSTQKISITTHF